MSLRTIKLFFLSLITLLLAACGGESAPPPASVTVVPGEASATVTWNGDSNVDYWVLYQASASVPNNTCPATAPDTAAPMRNWFGAPGGGTGLSVTSPYAIAKWVGGVPSVLVNGTCYWVSINGRTNGGPGGAGSKPVQVTPRLAGTNWTAGAPVATTDLRAVAYGGVAATTATASTLGYVAAGTGGAMYSSVDAITWKPINFVTASAINGANYFAGSFTLVGDGGVVFTSPDTVTWTTQALATTAAASKPLYAIANNGALTVAVGQAGTIIASTNNVNWTVATNTTITHDLYAVTYGVVNSVGVWIAVGANGTLLKSADGISWTAVNLASVTTASLRGVAFGSNTSATNVVTPAFVAVGDGGTVISSADGVNWTGQTPLNGGAALNAVTAAVTYGSVAPAVVSLFVATGANGAIFTGTDGLNWTARSPVTGASLYAVARNTTLGTLGYVAVGASGANLLSK